MVKAKLDWRWVEAKVDKTKEHIELSYGKAVELSDENWKPIARIGKPEKNIFPVEWLIQKVDPEYGEMLGDAQQELDFYLVEKNETDPWVYAIYHCGTSANIYSSVHWSYYQKGNHGEIEETDTDINKAVFIRHKLRTTTEILEDLWKKRQIAIHFEDNESIDPDDYEKTAAKKALKKLIKYCEMGVVVGAVYRQIRPVEMLVGIIQKGSKIVPVTHYGKDYIYKTVQLQHVKEISLRDYPLLAAIQPIYITINGWPGAFDTLKSIVFDKPIPISVENLSPGQLEVMCQEYLRMKGYLKVLLLPIGRNLQDIDILGIQNDGEKIVAQVTHSSQLSKVDSKLQRLKQFKEKGAKLIFFGPESCRIVDSDVQYKSIEKVFSEFRMNNKAVYPKAIDLMFNK